VCERLQFLKKNWGCGKLKNKILTDREYSWEIVGDCFRRIRAFNALQIFVQIFANTLQLFCCFCFTSARLVNAIVVQLLCKIFYAPQFPGKSTFRPGLFCFSGQCSNTYWDRHTFMRTAIGIEPWPKAVMQLARFVPFPSRYFQLLFRFAGTNGQISITETLYVLYRDIKMLSIGSHINFPVEGLAPLWGKW